MKSISILIPAYNEEENIPTVIQRIDAVIRTLQDRYRFEVIVLDNCSTDQTGVLVKQKCATDPVWRYLRYSRNFGAESSMLAGLDHASGDAVINVFSDLQDPPEMIPQMIGLWERGGELVYGVVQERNDSSILKTVGAKIAYKLIRFLAECDIPENATDFRLLDRRVVDVLCELREPDRYLRGLVHWVGFTQVGFKYDRAPREKGQSNANLLHCVKLAFHAIVCFSAKPLHLAVMFGALLTVGSIFLSILYLVLYFARPAFLTPPPPGVTTILLLTVFTIGTQSLFMGIAGEYIGRIYNQGKKRPLYVIAQKEGFASCLDNKVGIGPYRGEKGGPM